MAPSRLPDELRFIENRRATQKTTTASLAGRVCVVSGSTSGVGLEAVRRLARGGAHIVQLCRNAEKAERVRAELTARHGVPVEIVTADFSDLASVRAAAELLLRSYPRIDVLINSAGLFSTGRVLTREGFELVFCVNHLAPFLLTHLLLGRLREGAPARIIQVNSEGHRFGGLDPDDLNWERRRYGGYRGYGASKIAQLLTTWEFADRLQGSDVTINAMHPGDVKTNIGNNNGPLYRWFQRHVTWHMLKDPIISGEALYYLAAAPEMAAVSGRFFHLTIEEKPAAPALDRAMGRRIWDLSLQLTGFRPGL
ncbi:MAG: SDR family NAD(P)-dependent oxidoreductase [Planctomycetes bacterium]|nr:SDR family NAD(P)-dependent oxidoreductase [Planctomycetota bacterium]